jgi:hypothetical protein
VSLFIGQICIACSGFKSLSLSMLSFLVVNNTFTNCSAIAILCLLQPNPVSVSGVLVAGGSVAIVVGVQSYFIVSPSSSFAAVTVANLSLNAISVSVVGCRPLKINP